MDGAKAIRSNYGGASFVDACVAVRPAGVMRIWMLFALSWAVFTEGKCTARLLLNFAGMPGKDMSAV